MTFQSLLLQVLGLKKFGLVRPRLRGVNELCSQHVVGECKSLFVMVFLFFVGVFFSSGRSVISYG